MAKAKSVYSSTECGGQVLQWQGQCPHCQAWNTLVETIAEEVRGAYARPQEPVTAEHGMVMPAWLGPVAALSSPLARHELFEKHVPNYAFNRSTHEKDLFTASDVDRRVRRWRRLVLERKVLAPA